MDINTGLVAIASGIAVLTGAGAGVSIGISTGKAVEAVSRQPEAYSKILVMLMAGNALAEATAIYGFLIALILIFQK